jgi:hypothetical protein
MAGFQNSQYIDVLGVRKIFAKGDNNTTIPANSFLGTDGLGGTQWVDISTIKNGITFNTFVTTQSTFTSGIDSSAFSILDGDNAGLVPSASGNSVTMYAKAFGEIHVVGQESIKAFDPITGNINSNAIITGTGVVNISTDTNSQLINFYSPDSAASSMSTTVGNFSSLNNFLTTTITTFNSPFSTFIYSAISSFSTSQGTSLSQEFTTDRLNVSTINMAGTRQPFIQYGSRRLNSQGSNVVTLPNNYIDGNYIIQLTYSRGFENPTIPISFKTVTASNFIVVGYLNTEFHWTTYGNVV